MKRTTSLTPAWPLHLRHAQERAARRAERRQKYVAWTSGVVARDASLVALVGLVIFALVWVTR